MSPLCLCYTSFISNISIIVTRVCVCECSDSHQRFGAFSYKNPSLHAAARGHQLTFTLVMTFLGTEVIIWVFLGEFANYRKQEKREGTQPSILFSLITTANRQAVLSIHSSALSRKKTLLFPRLFENLALRPLFPFAQNK